MHSTMRLAVAVSSLLGISNAAVVLDERATTNTACTSNALAKLMVALPAYAAPFCSSAVKVVANTPTVTQTITPTM